MLDLRRPLTRVLLASCLALPVPAAPALAQTTQNTPATPTTTAAPAATPAPAGSAPAGTQGTTGTAGTTTPPAAAATPPVDTDRIDFQLKFPAEHGGGSASGSAVNLEYKR